MIKCAKLIGLIFDDDSRKVWEALKDCTVNGEAWHLKQNSLEIGTKDNKARDTLANVSHTYYRRQRITSSSSPALTTASHPLGSQSTRTNAFQLLFQAVVSQVEAAAAVVQCDFHWQRTTACQEKCVRYPTKRGLRRNFNSEVLNSCQTRRVLDDGNR